MRVGVPSGTEPILTVLPTGEEEWGLLRVPGLVKVAEGVGVVVPAA